MSEQLVNSLICCVIIGAQRSATTSLLSFLQSGGARIQFPNRPEPKWFLQSWREGNRLDRSRYLSEVFGFRNDLSFESITFVEKTTSYYEFGEVAPRLRSVLGNPQVICLVRDPVQRAISNYWFTRANGIETREPKLALLSDTLIPDTDETGLFIVPAQHQLMKMYSNPFDYIGRSRYEDLLQPWIAEFCLHEDFSVLETESFANSACQQVSLIKKLNLTANAGYPRENAGSPHNFVDANLIHSMRELFADTYEWCDDVLGIRF